MKLDFIKIAPLRYQNVSYETDVPENVKQTFTEQIRQRKGVYLYGEAGVGKTHIACALIKHLTEKGIEAKFYNAGDFLEQLREDFEKGGYYEDEDGSEYLGLFRETMNFPGVLVFDDLGAEKISDWARERFYLIINKKYEDMIPMIFTSNVDLEIISARLGDRVASRIVEMVQGIRCNGEDKRLNMNTTNDESNK